MHYGRSSFGSTSTDGRQIACLQRFRQGFFLPTACGTPFRFLRGAGWMARIRSGNLKMALVVLAVAALWLTPVRMPSGSRLPARKRGSWPERPATRMTFRRFRNGERPGRRRPNGYRRRERTGGEALAEWLAQSGSSDTASGPSEEEERQALIAGIVRLCRSSPPARTGTRDSYLLLMQTYELRKLAEACRRSLPGGGAGCLMVVADLLPEYPGEEVILGLTMDGWAAMDGLMMRDNAILRQGMRRVDGTYLETDDILRLMEDWQVAPPPVAPVRFEPIGNRRKRCLHDSIGWLSRAVSAKAFVNETALMCPWNHRMACSMYGLLLRSVQAYTRATHGAVLWARVLRSVDHPADGFEPMLSYPQDTLDRVLAACSAELDRPPIRSLKMSAPFW